MTAPDVPLQTLAPLKEAMPQQPTSPPPEEASSPNQSKWVAKQSNGLHIAEKASLEKPQLGVVNGGEQANAAEGAAPLPEELPGPQAPKIVMQQNIRDQPIIKPVQPPSKPLPAPPPTLTLAQGDALAELEGILRRMSSLDTAGWFQYPMMRSKIQNLQYVTWSDLEQDFMLICSNATTYNQKRSKVHKQALTMLKNGKKLISEVELGGRRAFSVLFPSSSGKDGGETTTAAAAAAAAGVVRGVTAAPSFLTPTSALVLPTVQDAGTSADDVEDRVLGEAQSYGDVEMDAAGYSSYDDDDGDGGGEPHITDEPLLLQQRHRLGQQQKQQQRMSAGEVVVVERNWRKSSSSSLPIASFENKNEKPDSIPSSSSSRVANSAEWKEVKRSIEWRMQWTQVRLKELEHQRERHREAAAVAQRGENEKLLPPPPVTIPVTHHSTPAATPATATTLPQQQQQQQQKMYPHLGSGGGGAGRQSRPDLELPGLLQHPFFAAHSMLVPTTPIPLTTTAAAVDDVFYPAKAHAALSLLTGKLSSLRQQLVSLQSPAAQQHHQHHSLLSRAASGAAARGRGRGRGRGAGGSGGGGGGRGTTPRSYSYLAGTGAGAGTHARQSSMYAMHADESSLRLGKRRRGREEYDLNDMVTPSGSLCAPKFVERPQVKAIETPQVRLLPVSEVAQRSAAITTYADAIAKGDEAAAVAAAAAIDALCAEEGSSDEDDDEGLYAERHARSEVEEKARYEAFNLNSLRRAQAAAAAVGKGGDEGGLSENGVEGSGRGRGMKPVRTTSAPATFSGARATEAVAVAAAVATHTAGGRVLPNGTAATAGGAVLSPPQPTLVSQSLIKSQVAAAAAPLSPASMMSHFVAAQMAAAAAAATVASTPGAQKNELAVQMQQQLQLNSMLAAAQMVRQNQLSPGGTSIDAAAATAAGLTPMQLQAAMQAMAAAHAVNGTGSALNQDSSMLHPRLQAIIPKGPAPAPPAAAAPAAAANGPPRPRPRPPSKGVSKTGRPRGRPPKHPKVIKQQAAVPPPPPPPPVEAPPPLQAPLLPQQAPLLPQQLPPQAPPQQPQE